MFRHDHAPSVSHAPRSPTSFCDSGISQNRLSRPTYVEFGVKKFSIIEGITGISGVKDVPSVKIIDMLTMSKSPRALEAPRHDQCQYHRGCQIMDIVGSGEWVLQKVAQYLKIYSRIIVLGCCAFEPTQLGRRAEM